MPCQAHQEHSAFAGAAAALRLLPRRPCAWYHCARHCPAYHPTAASQARPPQQLRCAAACLAVLRPPAIRAVAAGGAALQQCYVRCTAARRRGAAPAAKAAAAAASGACDAACPVVRLHLLHWVSASKHVGKRGHWIMVAVGSVHFSQQAHHLGVALVQSQSIIKVQQSWQRAWLLRPAPPAPVPPPRLWCYHDLIANIHGIQAIVSTRCCATVMPCRCRSSSSSLAWHGTATLPRICVARSSWQPMGYVRRPRSFVGIRHDILKAA